MRLTDRIRSEAQVVSRFSLIGIIATLIHMGVSFCLLNITRLSAQEANFFGFLTALGFSYLGHYHFSFKSTRAHGDVIPRFLSTTVLSYLANFLLVAALTTLTSLGDNICLFAGICIMPLVSLTLSRLWVY